MKKILQLSFILSLFLTACTAPRIAVLTPNVPTQYVDREGFTTQKADSLAVTFGYLFSTRDHLVFEVAVKNNGADSVLIDPQQFSFQHVSLLDTNALSAPFAAQSFKEITDKLNERHRDAMIKTTIITLAVIATTIAIERSVNSKASPRYRDYSFATNLGVDLTYNYFDALIYNSLSKKEARRGLEKSFMFPLKIGPAEAHIGAVYFPRYDDAKQLLFNFKVGERPFQTLFQQTIRVR
jgi:hypothetical protein